MPEGRFILKYHLNLKNLGACETHSSPYTFFNNETFFFEIQQKFQMNAFNTLGGIADARQKKN